MKKLITLIIVMFILLVSSNTKALTFEKIGEYRFTRNDEGELIAFYSYEDKLTVIADNTTRDMYSFLKGNGGITNTIVEYVNILSERGDYRKITKDFKLQGYTFNFTIPLNVYYKKAINDTYFEKYWEKSETNIYIDDFLKQIIAKERSIYWFDGVKAILQLREYITYTDDENKMLGLDYFATPIETLVEGAEDCDGMSITIGTLLERYSELGGKYDLDVIYLDYQTHVALGVNGYTNYGTYYTYNSKKYYTLESTSNTEIGVWLWTDKNKSTLIDLIIK